MIEQFEEDNFTVRDNLEIDESGIKKSTTFDIQKLVTEHGIKNFGDFLKGYEDGASNNDFTESSTEYIKGYKYGRTGEL